MQKYALWFGGALLFLAAAVYLLYANDWRIGENWLPTRTGTIEVTVGNEWTVFLDNRKIDTRNSEGTAAISKAIPGDRGILVAREGYWPWTKKVTLQSGGAVSLTPFSVATTPTAHVLTTKDAEYQTALSTIKTAVLPSLERPLTSADKTIELFIESGNLRARWTGTEADQPQLFCEGPCGPIDVLRPDKSAIRSVSFFGNRSDVVIVALTNGVFAIDLNPIGTQNFQPLYLGTEPVFVPIATSSLYIKDTSFYIRLEYEP